MISGSSQFYGSLKAQIIRVRCFKHSAIASQYVMCLQAKSGYRVLWFTSVKACINTLMVFSGWKNPGHFKFTPKAGISADEAAVSGALEVSDSDNNSGSPETVKGEKDGKAEKEVKPRKKVELSKVHGVLSKVLIRCACGRFVLGCIREAFLALQQPCVPASARCTVLYWLQRFLGLNSAHSLNF